MFNHPKANTLPLRPLPRTSIIVDPEFGLQGTQTTTTSDCILCKSYLTLNIYTLSKRQHILQHTTQTRKYEKPSMYIYLILLIIIIIIFRIYMVRYKHFQNYIIIIKHIFRICQHQSQIL